MVAITRVAEKYYFTRRYRYTNYETNNIVLQNSSQKEFYFIIRKLLKSWLVECKRVN